ncbi:MAG TPA: NAD(P)/FAD-dependent oxidoreductase [Bryobacteraceae bacterium]|nr:NAD(P)/FAD-dependent oxidoreductase [Bryobacteraceae bacterium]
MEGTFDVIIAGAGPAGLSAAETVARRGRAVLVVEQNHEIGSPIRTSGGSFIDELDNLGIRADLYHQISRVRFLSRTKRAVFEYPQPILCVLDVRRVFQFLAERACAAGAQIRLGTVVDGPLIKDGFVAGVRTRDQTDAAKIVIDATGYRSALLKQAGLDPGFERFGVGAEYDLFAPHCDQDEAVLIVGGVAPSGYAWVFPWGHHRVRVGVGIIHPDHRGRPEEFLDHLMDELPRLGVNLTGAQPIEKHAGLIPSERFSDRFAGDGILGVGDAAGHASSLLGEGIRWAIYAGRMAGEVAAGALDRGDVSRAALGAFEKKWRKKFGGNLKLAHRINQRIAKWDDATWDRRMEIVKRLPPAQFAEGLKTNLTGGLLWSLLSGR